jgi:hypothetical protein
MGQSHLREKVRAVGTLELGLKGHGRRHRRSQASANLGSDPPWSSKK